MNRFLPILILAVSACGCLAGAAQTSEQGPPSANSGPGIPVDLENARKAKALLAQAIQALGGQAYLNVRDTEQSGRAFSFHHGRPTSNGILFWRFTEFPDKERVEVTKERDVAQVYNGDKGFEITYKGARPLDENDLTDYLRRRRLSLDTILRTWVNDPSVALFYDGNAVASERPALQVTLISAKNEAVTLYFDADTHLPIKKTFTWRDLVDKQRNTEEEIYDNYRPVQGLMVPYNFTRYFNGDMAAERFLNSFTCNQGLNPAMFDSNSGYSPNKSAGKH